MAMGRCSQEQGQEHGNGLISEELADAHGGSTLLSCAVPFQPRCHPVTTVLCISGTHFCATQELQALGWGFFPLLPRQNLHFPPTELNPEPFAGWEQALEVF